MKESQACIFYKRENIEMKLYRMIGIKWFQSACFSLERWTHRKDRRINSNYHLRQFSQSGISGHFAYLSFNIIAHVISLILLFLTIPLNLFWEFHYRFWEIGLVICVLINVYCILLQRYNTLRFKAVQQQFRKYREIRIQKNVQLLQRDMLQNDLKEEREQDLNWLRELKKAVTDRKDFIISEEDSEKLQRLDEWRKRAGIRWHYGCKKNMLLKRQNAEGSEAGSAYYLLYTRIDVRTDWILKHISHGKKNLLKSFALITADVESERAFHKLFEEDNEDRIMEVVDSFLETAV